MRVRGTSAEGRSVLTQGVTEGDESTWLISTGLSVRVTAVKDIDGRPTAQRVDAYMTIRATCSSAVDSGLNRATISWRGTRLP